MTVGQVHVEQHQVDRLLPQHPRRVLRRHRDGYELEARHVAHVLRVRLRRDSLVLDDQRADHASSPISTSTMAPPSAPEPTRTLPPWRRTT